jgi:hypothetical chaperone protein
VTSCCAIDFGTSNSGVALPLADGRVGLVDLEDGQTSMPTAVFYLVDDTPGLEPARLYGRAALAAYVDGLDGRLMRSMKSILGSGLIEQHTDVGGGRSLRYLDVITGYLRHLKARAEASAGTELRQVVLGRPVYFVDHDPVRDAQAQAALEAAAHAVGFEAVSFQFEPIAAALDYERSVSREERVLVADIGGGTSDFSLVRVGPARRAAAERRNDILANHGVHIAGTDFDRRLELAAILPLAGYRALGPQGREVPNRVYFDLATWHLINTVYGPARVAELRRMRDFYADARQHARLMKIVTERLGHSLAAQAEQAKIAVADGERQLIDLSAVEPGLSAILEPAEARSALEDDLERIAAAALETVSLAGLSPNAVDTVYFTGGSTGLDALTRKIALAFPASRHVHGERFASVAQGLGEQALRRYAASPS